MKIILKYHILAFLTASVISFGIIILVTKNTIISDNNKIKFISSNKTGIATYTASFKEGIDAELNLLWSLQEKNGVTLLGSSELTSSSQFVSHDYVTKQLNFRVTSFGHQHFQSFAIYCSLLTFNSDLKNSNVSIIVSPGWFETEGTNIEAFLEFIRPNFLDKIIKDEEILYQEKVGIGRYLFQNRYLINRPDKRINYFINLFMFSKIPFLKDYFENRSKEFEKIEYENYSGHSPKSELVQIDWENKFSTLTKQFTSSIHSNSFYIIDDYYNEFLKENYKHGDFKKLNLNNQELKDLMLLVGFLKRNKANVSIIIQNLNPYHYKNLDRFNPILNKMINYFNSNSIPYINMFTSNPKDYIPGTLNDIMHTGDLGWMKINKFLVDTYVNK